MNVFTFSGRLGKDATINNAGTTKVINFSVAMDVGFGDKKHSIWIDVSKFGDNVKLAEYLKKGQQVAVSGELDTRTYDAKDGSKVFVLTCRANGVDLVGGKPVSNDEPVQGQEQKPSFSQQTAEIIDDLPFSLILCLLSGFLLF